MRLNSWLNSLCARLKQPRRVSRRISRTVPADLSRQPEELEDKTLLAVNPVFTAVGPFFVDEDAADTTFVGDVDANDGDGGGGDVGITYTFAGGNTGNAFAIDGSTGAITVNDAAAIDF